MTLAALMALVGKWVAVDLAAGGDPGAPDESAITITETEIRFDNGGGGFANGPYVLGGEGKYVAASDDETIEFVRAGEELKVTFAGGGYGTGTTVVYQRSNRGQYYIYSHLGSEGDSARSKYMADASDDTRPRKQRIRSSTGAAPSVGEVPSTSARHLPITSAEDTAASSSNVYFPPGYGIREAIPGTATAAAGGRESNVSPREFAIVPHAIESNAQPSCIKIGGVWCCCLLLLLLLALVFGDVGAHGDEWNPDPRCWRKGCL